MKTIILYASKRGAAAEIARRVAEKIGGAALHDLKKGGVPSIGEFDCVIVGGSLYVGMIRKEAKAFVARNADALRGKKLGLFLSGLEADKEKEYFDANFPADILRAAKAAGFLGGIFDPQKAGFVERLVMKAVAKQSAYVNTIDDSKIDQFVKALKA